MENYPSKYLSDAVDAINSLPGIGRKTSLRLALFLLRQSSENVHHFTGAINALRDNARYCSCCNMISDAPVCSICSDHSRNENEICVVADVRDVLSIESTGQYHGVYHVLGGVISPIDGIGPGDLAISLLVDRLQDRGSETELIFALSGDVEGDTTAFYIYRRLCAKNIRFSTLARGLGFGDGLEYADSLTLGRSIANRQPFKV